MNSHYYRKHGLSWAATTCALIKFNLSINNCLIVCCQSNIWMYPWIHQIQLHLNKTNFNANQFAIVFHINERDVAAIISPHEFTTCRFLVYFYDKSNSAESIVFWTNLHDPGPGGLSVLKLNQYFSLLWKRICAQKNSYHQMPMRSNALHNVTSYNNTITITTGNTIGFRAWCLLDLSVANSSHVMLFEHVQSHSVLWPLELWTW